MQLKGCTVVSRMPFAHSPVRRFGQRSYLLYSLASVHSREKTLVFPRLRQFLALQLSCPMNFCKETNFLLMKLTKNQKKLWMLLHFLCPGTIPVPRCRLSCQMSCCTSLLLVAWGGIVPPLHSPCNGLNAVMRRGPHSFTIKVGTRDEIVSISRLKACTEADAMPGSPPRHGRPPGKHPGGPASTKQVSFLDPLVSSPSSSQAPQSNGPETVFPVTDRFFDRPGPAEQWRIIHLQWKTINKNSDPLGIVKKHTNKT